ncbi:MAG: glycosyltransferase [Bacteroidales bacterium]|nr:glycosyltransferase [Bacteroidales bacterium]
MSETANHTPLVSVVMATFNETPEMISTSINSILQQTLRDFELLIIDDSTNTETIQAIDTFAETDNRIRIIRSTTRFGFVPALNEGLRLAKGKFIARMDGDDISEPTRLEKEVAFFNQYSNIAVVGTFIYLIDEEGKIISSREYPLTKKQIRKKAIFRSPLAHPTVMMRRSLIDDGFFYNPDFKKAEDYELWLRLMRNNYVFGNLNEKLLRYRILTNMTQKRNKQHFFYALKAKWKNFDFGHPLTSTLSVIFGCMIYLSPAFVLRRLYNIENNQS